MCWRTSLSLIGGLETRYKIGEIILRGTYDLVYIKPYQILIKKIK